MWTVKLSIAFLICLYPTSFAHTVEKQDCDKAMDALPRYDASKKMFSALHTFFKNYGSCMDGGIAEGAASVTTEVLTKDWQHLVDVANLLKSDTKFKQFILGNIEPRVTGQEGDVAKIIEHAKKKCPSGMKSFCNELIQICQDSLKPEE